MCPGFAQSAAAYNDELAIYLAPIACLLVCLLTGLRLTRELSLPLAVRFGLGAAVVSQAMFVFLATGTARPVLVWGVAVVWCAVAAVGLRKGLGIVWERPGWPCLVWVAVGAYTVLYLVHAAAPEIQADGYTYHLGLVKEWRERGGFGPRVGFYEMLPQGMEALYLLASLLAPGMGKVVHVAFIAGGAMVVRNLCQRFELPDWPAVLLWVCAPVVGITGTAAYNDVALGFAVLCTFYLLVTGHPRLAAVMAGWCYALKLPGLVFVAAVLGWLAVRRRWRELAWATGLACLMVGPWVARTWWMSGNPVAPLYNRIFPNPYFHINTEEVTVEYLRTYGVDWLHRWWEVTVKGQNTTGLIGPVFLLVPLTVLAVRRREGRWLWAAIAVALVPWVANAGTRFLIPGLGLFCVAMAMALPKRVAMGLALVHAAISWPGLIPLYADTYAWQLRGFPWRAALRVEAAENYLSRQLWEYRVARMVDRHVKAEEQVLDFLGLPDAYTHSRPMRTWLYAEADTALDAIKTAMEFDQTRFYRVVVDWAPVEVRGVRITNGVANEWPWGLQEVSLMDGGEKVQPRLSWELWGQPNGWDANLAMDSNLTTRWQGWQERKPGMRWEVEFGRPLRVSGIRVMCYRADAERLTFAVQMPDGGWRTVPGEPRIEIPVALSLRRQAMAHLRRAGFEWVLAQVEGSGLAPVGKALVWHKGDWGLEKVAQLDSAVLLRVQ